MYGEDTTFHTNATSIAELNRNLEEDMKCISSLSNNNRMVIITSKTKAMSNRVKAKTVLP